MAKKFQDHISTVLPRILDRAQSTQLIVQSWSQRFSSAILRPSPLSLENEASSTSTASTGETTQFHTLPPIGTKKKIRINWTRRWGNVVSYVCDICGGLVGLWLAIFTSTQESPVRANFAEANWHRTFAAITWLVRVLLGTLPTS